MRLRLKDLREDNDIKQSVLANYLHVKPNTYSQYETGKRQIPMDTYIKLALYFDTSIDYLVGLSSDPTPTEREDEYKFKQKK